MYMDIIVYILVENHGEQTTSCIFVKTYTVFSTILH